MLQPPAFWIEPVLIAPLIEEAWRTRFVFGELKPAGAILNRHAWLAFALGYAILESGTKLGDTIVALSTTPRPWLDSFASLSGPIVPFLLHMFLGFLAIYLRKNGRSAFFVFAVACALHVAHNASVFASFPFLTSFTALLATNIIRVVIFSLLIGLVWRAAKRTAPITSPD